MDEGARPPLGYGLPDPKTTLVPLNNPSAQLEASRVIKTGPGILYGFTVSNTSGGALYVQVFDAATVPGDGAFPIMSKSVPANDATGFNWIPGRSFNAGIILVLSSTNANKTLATAVGIFDAQYL